VTFFAIILFGWLLVALVQRMERALLLARRETLRREQAERERADAELMALESEMVGRLALKKARPASCKSRIASRS